MPMMRFISPLDPMWLSAMRTIEERLVEDTLVRRYEVEQTHVDAFPMERVALPHARSGLSNAWLVQVNSRKRSYCLKSF